MELRPTNELLWHVLSRLTPESRSFLLHSLGLRQRPKRGPGPQTPAKEPDRPRGKLLAWRRSRHVYAALSSDRLTAIRKRAAALEAERLAARELAEEILALPPEHRGRAVDENDRFRTLALAEQLLERSRKLCFQNPQQGWELAELGLRIVQQLDPDHYEAHVVQDACGRAWSEVANCYRLSSDHAKAERALLKAAACLRDSFDPLEHARFFNLKAALRKDQRRFEDAFKLRDRALTIYTRFEDWHSLGKTLNNKGSDYLEMGEPKAAIDCLRKAVHLLDPEVEPRAVLAAHHNLILALLLQERAFEASEVFSRVEDTYGEDLWSQARRHWVRGRIAAGLGRLGEAERAFRVARKGFQDREIAYDFALVSLDLALIYARQGQTSEVKRLASEMMPIFKSRRIHREALAALTLFRQAVEQETVTVESLRKIIAQLERAPRKA